MLPVSFFHGQNKLFVWGMVEKSEPGVHNGTGAAECHGSLDDLE